MTVTNALTVDNFKYNPGIYFEEMGTVGLYNNEWHIILYYDLRNFKYELEKLNKYSDDIQSLCQYIKIYLSEVKLCNEISKQIHINLITINQNALLLNSKNYRFKRALFNAIGTLSKTLFGTLDDNDAAYYDQQIELIKQNEDQLQKLIHNQTLIVETTANIFNKSMSNITSQFFHIQQKLNRFNETLNTVNSESKKLSIISELEGFSTIMLLMITRYQNIQNTLIDLITDAKHGKPHASIITPDQIKSILERIQKEIPKSLILPITKETNNLLQIYQLSHIRLAPTEDKLIFEFRIPLPSRQSYQLYKIYPLLTIHEHKFVYIKPSTEYLSIDYDRERYYQLNNFDFGNCLTSDLKYYLCRTSHPIFLTNNNNTLCEIQLLKHTNTIPPNCKILEADRSNFWIQLSQPNKWLFSTYQNLTIDEICESNITPVTLRDSGIIEISQGCYLKSTTIVLHAHNLRNTTLNNFYLPSINLTTHLKTHIPIKTFKNSPNVDQVIKFYEDQNLKDLLQAIENQKASETNSLNNIRPHIIHHYSISYILLFSFILSVTIFIIRKYKSKNINFLQQNQANTHTQNPNYQLTVNTQALN